MLYSPLEQFDIIYLFDLFAYSILSEFDIKLFISNLFIYFFFIFFLISLLIIYLYCTKDKGEVRVYNVYKSNQRFNLKFFSYSVQYIFELLFKFVIDIIYMQAGVKALPFVPLFFVVFIIILFSNLLGMLPFGFTITGHLSITFFLALSFNIGFLILGFWLHGIYFFKLFIPSGAPKFLLPLIIVIELLSYLIRTFSLSIRLFANMMAGHCLLFVISSFVFNFFSLSFIFSIIPVSLIYIAIFILEFAIVFLQTYVFTILLAIYLNDSIHPGH